MNNYRPCWKDTNHCPAILLVTEDCRRVLDFKQWLEAEGCQVYRANINNVDELLTSCRHVLFDLIVLNVEAPELSSFKEIYKMIKALYNNLKAVPALLTLPMVVLTACEQVETALERLAIRPVHCIRRDDEAATSTLLQTIEQIYYLTYRYG
jgi:CheY-like chemotaxis protein